MLSAFSRYRQRLENFGLILCQDLNRTRAKFFAHHTGEAEIGMYNKWTKTHIRQELQRRNLRHDGTKDELKVRLEGNN